MNESCRSDQPDRRTDGRDCERKSTHARTHASKQAGRVSRGRIRSLCVKRSVRYVSLVREADLIRVRTERPAKSPRFCSVGLDVGTSVDKQTCDKNYKKKTDVCAIKYSSDKRRADYESLTPNIMKAS